MIDALRIDVVLAKVQAATAELNRFAADTEAAMGRVQGSGIRAQSALSALRAEVPLLDRAFRVLTNPIVAGAVALGAFTAGISQAVDVAGNLQQELTNANTIVSAGLNTQIAQRNFRALEESAKRLGRETEFTAIQIAQGFEFLGRAGLRANESIQAIEPTLALATVGQLDLARAADIATNIMSQFQLQAENLPGVIDAIAKTTVTSNTNVIQLSEAMKFAGPTAQAFGISLEDTLATIGIFANNGLQGSIATRAFGTALTRLASPTARAADIVQKLGINAFDSSGRFVGLVELVRELEDAFDGLSQREQQEAIARIFGAESIQEFNILLSSGSENLAKYSQEIQNAARQNGAFAQSIRAERLNTFRGSLVLARSAVTGLALEVGGPFLDVLSSMVRGFTDAVNGMTDFVEASGGIGVVLEPTFNQIKATFIDLPRIISESVPAIILLTSGIIAYNGATITASFATLRKAAALRIANIAYEVGFIRLVAIETATRAYSTIAGVLTGKIRLMTIAQGLLNVVMSVNPFSLAVLAVGALAAGFVLLYRESETFRAVIAGTINAIRSITNDAIEAAKVFARWIGLTGSLGEQFEILYRRIIPNPQLFSDFADGFIQVVDVIGDQFEILYRRIIPNEELLNSIAEGFSSFFDEIGNQFDILYRRIVPNEEVRRQIGNGFESIAQFSNPAAFALALGSDTGNAFVEGYIDSLDQESLRNGTRSGISDGVGDAIDSISNKVKDLASSVTGSNSGVLDRLLGGQGTQNGIDGINAQIGSIKNLSEELKKVQDKIQATRSTSPAFKGLIEQSVELQEELDKAKKKVDAVKLALDLEGIQITPINVDDLVRTIDEIPSFKGVSVQLTTNLDSLQLVRDASTALAELPEQKTVRVQTIVDEFNLEGFQALDRIPDFQTFNVKFAVDRSELNSLSSIDDFPDLKTIGIRFDVDTTQLQDLSQIEEIPDLKTIGIQFNVENQLPLTQLAQLEQIPGIKEISIGFNVENQLPLTQLAQLEQIPETKLISIGFDVENQAALTEIAQVEAIPDRKDVALTLTFNENQLQAIAPIATLLETGTITADVQIGEFIQPDFELEPLIATVRAGEVVLPEFDPKPLVYPVTFDQEEIDPITFIADITAAEETLKRFRDRQRVDPITIDILTNIRSDISTEFNTPNVQSLTEFQTAMASLGIFTGDTKDATDRLKTASDELGLSWDFVNKNFDTYKELLESLEGPQAQFLSDFGASKDLALEFSVAWEDFQEKATRALGTAVLSSIQRFGVEIGKSIKQSENFGTAIQNAGRAALSSLGDALAAIILEGTQLLGLYFLRMAVELGFPAGIPAALLGVAILGLGGLAAGLLSSDANSSSLSTPDGSDQISGLSGGGGGTGGLSALNPEEDTRTTVTNITVVIDSDGILSELETRQIINQENTDGG